jgi:hypothetical protein
MVCRTELRLSGSLCASPYIFNYLQDELLPDEPIPSQFNGRRQALLWFAAWTLPLNFLEKKRSIA